MKAIVHPNEKAPDMFKNKFLNKMIWSNPVLIFVIYAIAGAFLIYSSYFDYGLSILTIIALFGAGIISWTLTEYLLHRYVYHDKVDGSYHSGLHYILHGVHHSYPNDKSKTVIPPLPSIIILSLLYGLLYLIMGKFALAFSAGFFFGYGTYTMIHYATHQYKAPKKYNFWWRHHSIHHYQQHDRAFGVSSPLWDYVFRSMPEKNRRTIEIEIHKSTVE
ncbi:MAG: sterol desaturase family protein [Bacteroidia bacterium]